jgi:hypothetical protein
VSLRFLAVAPAIVILLSFSASAAVDVVYVCTDESGANMKLQISSAEPGATYSLKGVLSAPKVDASEPMIESTLGGSAEVLQGVHVYHMHEAGDLKHQVFAEIKAPGSKADVYEVWLRSPTEDKKRLWSCDVRASI